ncbi:MAG: type III pantothenate kinase [Bacteroidales bacterium]|nr:type III pantothenate kinase [Bacteroidales bacterium]
MRDKKVRFVVDEGNSLVKIAAYRGDEWLFFEQMERISDDFFQSSGLFHSVSNDEVGNRGIAGQARNDCSNHNDGATHFSHDFCSTQEKPKAIFLSTRKKEAQSYEQLSRFFDVKIFDHHTPVPVNNLYETPGTLGVDRLAAVVGATALFEKSDVLVIDAGTCITYDFVDAKKNYHGGGIMPGLQMKLQALHNFTGNLPLVSLGTAEKLCGRNTEEAILAGAINVTLLGLDALIACFKQQYAGLKTVLCGGNTKIVQNSLKNDTFAEPKLVLYGLKQILDFNEDR